MNYNVYRYTIYTTKNDTHCTEYITFKSMVYGCSTVYTIPLLNNSIWLFYWMWYTFAIRQHMVVYCMHYMVVLLMDCTLAVWQHMVVLHICCMTTVSGCSTVWTAFCCMTAYGCSTSHLLYDSAWLFYCICCTFVVWQCKAVLVYVLHICCMTALDFSSVWTTHLLYESIWLFYCMYCSFAVWHHTLVLLYERLLCCMAMFVLLYVLHICCMTVYSCSTVCTAPLLYDKCMFFLLYALLSFISVYGCSTSCTTHLLTVYDCSNVCAVPLLYDSVWLFYCMCCTLY